MHYKKAEDIYTTAGWEYMYQNRYLHGSRSRGAAKSAIYTAVGCQHKIAIYTAAVPKPSQVYMYTRLPCVHIKSILHGSHLRAKSAIYIAAGCIQKSLFTRQPFKSQIGYIHCCRVYTKDRYLHGSRSRAKSAIYIAARCIHKIVIYTAAVQEPIQDK